MKTTQPSPHSRRSALAWGAALLALPALTALPACAMDTLTRAQPPVELSLIDRDSGQPLTVYRKDGRSYVAGQPTTRYAIRLSNQSARRLLVVLSVDGVNVISGETAAYGQTGYVLEPWRSHDITGWRKSDTAVAAFEFAALADSYAARTGRPGNVGVIGAAVFLEKPPANIEPPVATAPAETGNALRDRAPRSEAMGKAAAAAPAPAAAADATAARSAVASQLAERSERLGTAHGQREWSVSRRTSFERASSQPHMVLEVAYDSLANLVAAGVVPAPVAQVRPRPFPEENARGFVADPPPRW